MSNTDAAAIRARYQRTMAGWNPGSGVSSGKVRTS